MDAFIEQIELGSIRNFESQTSKALPLHIVSDELAPGIQLEKENTSVMPCLSESFAKVVNTFVQQHLVAHRESPFAVRFPDATGGGCILIDRWNTLSKLSLTRFPHWITAGVTLLNSLSTLVSLAYLRRLESLAHNPRLLISVKLLDLVIRSCEAPACRSEYRQGRRCATPKASIAELY